MPVSSVSRMLTIAVLAASLSAADVPQPGKLLDQGYRQMYDLHFDQAHQTFAQYERNYPADPLGPVSDAAAYLFSELDRLHILQSELFVNNERYRSFRRPAADPQIKDRFLKDLDRAGHLAESQLRASPQNADALFADTLRRGLDADYLALIEKRDLAALSEVKAGRAQAQKLLSIRPDYYDAYLAIGIENYLLSLKPAPLRWVLQVAGAETDKRIGVENLQLTAEKGHYLLPYARLLLAVAALRDGNKVHARELLTWLSDQFPDNALYREELAKIK